MVKSKFREMNKEDWKKVGKGFGIAVGGAALSFTVELLPMIDWGDYQIVADIFGMVLVNLSLKYFGGK